MMTMIKKSWFKRGLSLLMALVMCMGAGSINTLAASSTLQPARKIEQIDVPVADGVYYANIDLWNATSNQASMGNAALRGSTSFKQKQPDDIYSKAIIVVENNKATAIVEFMPMGYIGMYGFMMELESVTVNHLTQYGGVYDKDAVFTPATVLARHMTEEGAIAYDAYNNPESPYVFNGQKKRPAGFGHEEDRTVDISKVPYSHILALDVTPVKFAEDETPQTPEAYTYLNAAYVHVFVPVMFEISATSGDQYAKMKVDWTSVEKIEEPEKNLQYSLWKAKQIEQGDYTDASYNALQNTINEITTDLENIWPNQILSMNGTGFNAQPKLEQKEYSDSEKAEMAKRIVDAVSALERKRSDISLGRNNLEDGVYSIYGEMIKVNRQDKSMANDAINHTVKLTVEDGKYYLTLDFQGLHYLNRFGYLAKLSYYDNGYTYGQYGKVEGTLVSAEVLSTQKNSDGSDIIDEFNQAGGSSEGLLYPDQLRFQLVSDAINETDGFVPLHVFVPVMEDISQGTGDQDVLLKLDWTTLKKTTEDDPAFIPEKPIELSPAVDINDAATGIKIHADKGVFEEGTKFVVKPISSGTEYDRAAKTLNDVGKKFKLYEIRFEGANKTEALPNGTVTVSYPIPAGYNAANVAVYRINEDGLKTLVKGVVEGNYYTVVTKSSGTYTLVEKGSTTSDVNSPKTGDNSNFALWCMLMIVSISVLSIPVFARKRRSIKGE